MPITLQDTSGQYWSISVDTSGHLTTAPASAPGGGFSTVGTYTPQSAIDLISNYVHGVPLDKIAAQACDMVNSQMWCFYPWAWSIATLNTISLVDGTQDYSATNTNILRPLIIRLRRTDISPNEVRELAALANLPVELSRKGGLDYITSYSWLASSSQFRLNYAAGISGTQAIQIEGFYQKTPTKITPGTMTTVLPFPDQYFNVFYEGVKWQCLMLSDDPRAGAAQYDKNGTMLRRYTGQYAVFMDALLSMARTEDLSGGDEFMWPERALGGGHQYFPGMFGI